MKIFVYCGLLSIVEWVENCYSLDKIVDYFWSYSRVFYFFGEEGLVLW